uniref:Uncharacterized protein n=1 Tax=Anopheles melas TaxID=34690 RepID=A0A182TFR2_9DIPT
MLATRPPQHPARHRPEGDTELPSLRNN